MARILVLEDDEQSRNALEKMLCSISAEVTVDTAADLVTARSLLDSTVSFHLFLLDVNLNINDSEDSGGLVFAEEVRKIMQYAFTPIVMITSIAALEIEAYRRIQCYQYILKPFDEMAVKSVVNKVLSHAEQKEIQFITVKKDGINYKIPCNDIVFCKAIPRGVALYMKEEKMDIPYLSIRQLLDRLPKHDFFQCHRMFVVNMQYIRYYDLVNQMIQVVGYKDKIDIGVTYKTAVRRRLNE
jgi:DNA-binding LytR/AlgR family response regulator